jgi:5'-methylthioinosine phosphorylase
MTAMPEAALAKELGLSYASCSVVANWAAGKTPNEITLREIHQNLVVGMERLRQLLKELECCDR